MLTQVTKRVVQRASLFLVVIGCLVVLTAIALSFTTGTVISECLYYTVGVFMGNTPEDTTIIQLGNGKWWFTFVRFLGWLMMPVLVGIIISERQEEIAREQRKLIEQEIRIRDVVENSLTTTIAELIELGYTEDQAVQIANKTLGSFQAALEEEPA